MAAQSPKVCTTIDCFCGPFLEVLGLYFTYFGVQVDSLGARDLKNHHHYHGPA